MESYLEAFDYFRMEPEQFFGVDDERTLVFVRSPRRGKRFGRKAVRCEIWRAFPVFRPVVVTTPKPGTRQRVCARAFLRLRPPYEGLASWGVLRQPRGFERFGVIGEVLDAEDSALA